MTYNRKLLPIIIAGVLVLSLALISGCGSETEEMPESSAEAENPVKLIFTAQPSDTIAGETLEPQLVLAAVDEQGNTVTSFGGGVVLAITGGTGSEDAHLYGGTRVVLRNGIAEFTYLYIDKAGTGYTLTATCDDLEPAVSSSFDISPGEPYKLDFSRKPSGGVAGEPFSVQPEVVVLDAWGNHTTEFDGSVTMALTLGAMPTGSELLGTVTVQAADGVAQFTDLAVTTTYPEYKLTARSPGLGQTTSGIFSITYGEPVMLQFTVQPENAIAGEEIRTQPKVAIEDKWENVVTSSRASVTVEIVPETGTAGAVLSGATTIIAEGGLGGLAVFDDLSIDLAGSGYQLLASCDGLTSAMSEAFDVASP